MGSMGWEDAWVSSVGICHMQWGRLGHWKALFMIDLWTSDYPGIKGRGGRKMRLLLLVFFPCHARLLLPDWCCRSLERVFSIGSVQRPCAGSPCQCYRSLSHFERGSKPVPRMQRTKPLQSRVKVTTCQHVSQPAEGQTWNTKRPEMREKRGNNSTASSQAQKRLAIKQHLRSLSLSVSLSPCYWWREEMTPLSTVTVRLQ